MPRFLHIVLMVLLMAAPASLKAQSSDHEFELSRQLDVFNNIYTLLDLNYVDSLDAKKNIGDAISHMLSSLDPYTTYYPEERNEELMQFVSGHYAGIGAGLRLHKGERRCVIRTIEQGGAAEKAGLRVGDMIMSIDNHDVGTAASNNPKDVEKYLLGIVAQLKGEAGSSFELEVRHQGQNRLRTYTVYRQVLESRSVPYAAMLSDSIGYIYLSQFNDNTETEMRKALGTLRAHGIQSLILDLRNNPGGTLQSAVKTVALFVPRETEVVRTKGKHSRLSTEIHYTTTEPIDELIPIVVLVDNGTASAAEITAGALQDYDRAVIMGRRTFGKGLVQSTYQLPYSGVLKMTTGKFYIPSGRCIQALDYTHRTESGEPTALPDSLAHEFLTSAGRSVYDGGGINPDIPVVLDTLPEIVTMLLESDVLYEYAADYVRNHRSIPSALNFELTENDFTDFKTAVITSDFKFGQRSTEALTRLHDIAIAEGFGKDVTAQMEVLYNMLTPDLDRSLEHWRRPVKRLVEQVIVGTYYGEAGELEYNLRTDEDVSAAIALLRDDRQYRSILTTAPER